MGEPKRCIGYGQFEGHCGESISPEARGLNPSELWCVNCELNRRENITRQMETIKAGFPDPKED